jgi:hypothetical protein
MGITKGKVAIHDDYTDNIIKQMEAGKSRAQISDERGDKSYKTLNAYMSRHYFLWDKENKKYFPIEDKVKNIYPKGRSLYSTTADEVIALLSEGVDPKEVALRTEFEDYKKMAVYMKKKGYEWSSEKNNYVPLDGETLVMEEIEPKGIEEEFNDTLEQGTASELNEYLPLLRLLSKNKDKLSGLLKNEEGRIPRYAIPGRHRTKPFYMSDALQDMIKEYCTEKNISQKEVIQVAAVEFFRKYGYKRQIDSLLKL